jgi:salicylate hydroxylase
MMQRKIKVIIIGAGLGGLACAIACRRKGLETVILERAPKIEPVCELGTTNE